MNKGKGVARAVGLDNPDRQGQDLRIPAVRIGEVPDGLRAHELFGVENRFLDLGFR
jgi:hypothetical protein